MLVNLKLTVFNNQLCNIVQSFQFMPVESRQNIYMHIHYIFLLNINVKYIILPFQVLELSDDNIYTYMIIYIHLCITYIYTLHFSFQVLESCEGVHHVEAMRSETYEPDLDSVTAYFLVLIKCLFILTYFCPPFQHLLSERLTSLGIMGAPRVPPLNPSETIVL